MKCSKAVLPCLLLLTCAPWGAGQTSQHAYIKASNTGSVDIFGFAVAISGNTAVVGAPNEDSNATGANGNQADNSVSGAGAAYIFVRNGATWTQQAYLKASNPGADDSFGLSVAISGDTVVIGAVGEDSDATGIDGNQASNAALEAGAAYVFVRNGTSWSQQAYLKASNTDATDGFGWTVALSGGTIVVGAHAEDSLATGVNGNQADNSAGAAGAAYVFVRSGSVWSQQAYLKASNSETSDHFGEWVDVSGDTIAVQSEDDSNATGVNGDPFDNSASQAGAVHVFVRSGTSWSQQAYLKAANNQAGDAFGSGLALDGDTLAVGAPGEDSGNGNPADNSLNGAGAVNVFVRSGTTWTQQAYLKASNIGQLDNFGQEVSVAGDVVAVGVEREDSAATGVNGLQSDNSATDSGAAYVFARSGTTWTQTAYVKASNTGAADGFARSLAVTGDWLLIGAHSEDSSATGVNGSQFNNGAGNSGAAYAFDLGFTPWEDIGFGLAGVNGVPQLAGTGSLMSGSPGSLALVNAKPSAICTLHVSIASTPVPFKGGTLVAFPTLLDIPLVTFPDGTMTLPFLWPAGLPPGTMLWFQYTISDLAAIKKVALSNALEATTP